MKELSTEEKAKAYDKAIEKAKGIHSFSSDIAEIKRMEQIFPELQESEDERIRKEIINYIKTGTYHKDWIAWLEKQSKQKSADNVEPKFKKE